MPAHSSASGTDLHEDKRFKEPVRAASTADVTLATPGGTLDGVTLVTGDRILLKNQTLDTQNGIYTWAGAAVALVRTPDTDAAADFVLGFIVYVREGTTNGTTCWLYSTTTTPIVLGSTTIAFTSLGGTGPTGATGPQGVQGVQGPSGATGLFTVAGAAPYICIQDQKTSGTSGGTFTNGAWRTRDLNTFIANDQNLAILDRVTNRVTLPPGTYRTSIRAPARAVGNHQSRLRDITGTGTTLVGSTARTDAALQAMTDSFITGRFGIRQTTTFEVQHQCVSTLATSGFGLAGGLGEVEVYTVAEFWLEAGPPPFLGLTPDNPNLDKILAKSFDALTSVIYLGQQSKTKLPFVTIGTTTSITNATGTIAVYTFGSPPAVTTGQAVTVTGATPSVYNVSAATITNVAGNTFSVDIGSSGNGAASVQGTAVLL